MYNNLFFFCPHRRGLCYLKIPHSAGATLKGINMRIARNFGQRHGMDNCIRHDGSSKGMDYPDRDQKSYLWTFVRDPTSRALSAVGSILSNRYIPTTRQDFYSKANETNTVLSDTALFMLRKYKDINNGIVSEGRGGFQLQYMMQNYIPENLVNKPLYPEEIADRQLLVKKISWVSAWLLFQGQLFPVKLIYYFHPTSSFSK